MRFPRDILPAGAALVPRFFTLGKLTACSLGIPLLISLGSATGCHSSQAASHGLLAADDYAAATVLALDRSEYPQVFDAAVALAADEGMFPELRDRDGGIIQTRPKVAGSLLEPWDWPRGSPKAALDATVAYQRRRVRFEFIPSGFRPAPVEDPSTLLGAQTPGGPAGAAGSEAVDLAAYEGPMELRVWVYVEQAFTPHMQRSTWTFSQTTFARDPMRQAAGADGTTRDRSIWTPIARDPPMEAILLAKLRERLASG
ncbi:MAG: hypothetical protein SGJ11_01310 [Phycisphaerae bacterium]|nr:hypothetical protein [Phycisphaerae bacterium]